MVMHGIDGLPNQRQDGDDLLRKGYCMPNFVQFYLNYRMTSWSCKYRGLICLQNVRDD